MIHQPSAGFQGQATDIEIHAREVLRLKQRLNELLGKHTGRSAKEIEEKTERDNFMTAEEARELGIVDSILSSRSEMQVNKE